MLMGVACATRGTTSGELIEDRSVIALGMHGVKQ
jgi:hypothetical protein